MIGAGRLGTALARALDRAGHRIELVVAEHAASAKRAARLTGGHALPVAGVRLSTLSAAARERLFQSDLVIISTPDDALANVAKDLSRAFKSSELAKRRGRPRVVLHTSGALSSVVLEPLRSKTTAVGSLHPLVAVADAGASPAIFRGVHFCVEGDPKAVRAASSIVRDLRGHSFTIDGNVKALYHAAAVTSAGHVVALFDLALEMLAACGLSRRRAHTILVPLLASTAGNLSGKTPAQALTGPFARGDLETIKRHLDAMKRSDIDDISAVYMLLGRRASKLTAAMGAKKADRIARLIDSRM